MILFEDFEIDRAAYELRRGGVPCPVEPQVFELLAYLAANPGRVVTKDEIIEQVWDGRIVSDAALSSRIKSARRAIGDDGERQRLIKTVHGRGVRFIGTLMPAPGEATAPSAAKPTEHVGGVAASTQAPSGRPFLTVLPLRTAGWGETDRYLAEVVTEEIVTCLARDRGLAVLSPGAHLPADGSIERSGQLSGHGAPYRIEGSVRRSGERLVVTIRLTNAVDGEHIWAERCEQALGAALAIDERFAARISAAVRGEIEIAEARRASARPEPERDAWALYHLGLRSLYQFTPQGLAEARKYFERAVTVDRNFASAVARLAYVHVQEYWYGPRDRRAQALDRAGAAALDAIALDGRNAIGHLAFGRVHALRHEFDLAMSSFETAVRLNPGLAQAHFALGQAHFFAGRPKEAVRLLEAAIELDPNDPHLWAFLHDQADAYYALGQLGDAERRARAASLLPNATHWPFASLASVLGSAGKIEAAREALCVLKRRSPDYSLSFAKTELEHFSDKGHVEVFLQGLKVAGLRDEAAPRGARTPRA